MHISSHSLPIETRRYRKILSDERIGPFCESSIRNEFYHALMKCNHSLFSRLRAVFLECLFTLNFNLSSMSLFIYIMTIRDENITTLSAHYIYNMFNCYKAWCDFTSI